VSQVPERPWYEELDPEEYEELFPGGKDDVDAFLARQAWREEHQGLPRTCEDAAVLADLARIILDSMHDDQR
jgi:hypothetical protein